MSVLISTSEPFRTPTRALAARASIRDTGHGQSEENTPTAVESVALFTRRCFLFLGASLLHAGDLGLAYVNAGHNAPVVLRVSGADCNVFRWEAGGAVIGLLPEMQYQDGCFELQPGDLIVLYTDGVSESMNTQDEEWGEERLIACAKACCCGLTAREAHDRLMSAAVAFAAGAPQHDDMTLVVLRVLASIT